MLRIRLGSSPQLGRASNHCSANSWWHSLTLDENNTMPKLLLTLALAVGLGGCVVAPPYAYGPAPGYYTYAPAYYAPPPVSVGIGGVFRIR